MKGFTKFDSKKPYTVSDHIFDAKQAREYHLLHMSTIGYKGFIQKVCKMKHNRVSTDNIPNNMMTTMQQQPENFYTNLKSGTVILPQQKHVRTWPLLFRRFKYCSLLGEGRFSQVILCDDTFVNNRKVAIKILNKKHNDIGIQESINYFKMQKKGFSKSISRLFITFYFDGHFCLVFEALGESLLSYIQRFQSCPIDLSIMRKLAVQLISGLSFMRQHAVIHADLKPENILMTAKDHSNVALKISDFGNAIDYSNSEQMESYRNYQIQTLYYRAPEVLLSHSFDFQIDVWSVGCILVEIFTGNPLFYCTNPQELYSKMVSLLGPLPHSVYSSSKMYKEINNNNNLKDEYNFQKKHTRLCRFAKIRAADYHFSTFLIGLLEYDPKKRFTPQQALLHPFLSPLFPFDSVFGSQSNYIDTSTQIDEEKQQLTHKVEVYKKSIEIIIEEKQKYKEECERLRDELEKLKRNISLTPNHNDSVNLGTPILMPHPSSHISPNMTYPVFVPSLFSSPSAISTDFPPQTNMTGKRVFAENIIPQQSPIKKIKNGTPQTIIHNNQQFPPTVICQQCKSSTLELFQEPNSVNRFLGKCIRCGSTFTLTF
ncbi:hypothetical protein ABK040_009545 [Willaertia magna]